MEGQRVVLKQEFLLKGLYLITLTLISSKIALGSPIRDSSPILGYSDQVRIKHLYADNEHTHLHLQITPEGKVSGTKEKNLYSVLEIKAVKPSILVIKGLKSTLYLCMDSGHHLYGSKAYKEDDCNFRETAESDGYNMYHSEKHRAVLSLTPTRGGQQMVRFIPLNYIPLESLHTEDDSFEPEFNQYVEGVDPLGMVGTGSLDVYSPSHDS